MNAEHKGTRQPHDRDAVVTYTRVSAHRRRPKRPVRRAPAEDVAPELTLDGAEVPSVEPDEPVAFDFAADERHRGGRNYIVDDLVDDSRRPNWLRYGLIGASLAVVAGVGILAATVGVATMLPGGSSQGEAPGAPALAYNSTAADAESPLTTGGIRQIPMPAGAPEAAWRTEVAPPIPRPRPDDGLTRAEPEPEATDPQSAPKSQPIGVGKSPPGSTPDVAASPVPVANPPGDSGSNGLITSIEETLARIDAQAPAAPPEVELQAQPPVTEPPVVMTPPIYPPADVAPLSGRSGAIEPAYDVAPPPATVDGYGGYPTEPVPPEPVPDFYPQAPQLGPVTPGLYPSAPYAFPPPDYIEETEARRPGLLRRTFAKATDAVGRVFARN